MEKGRYKLSAKKRIHKQREYSEIFKKGRRLKFPEFILIFKENSLPYSRVGISVGRKFGNAVRRNRAKRLCRELFRLNQHNLPEGIDIVFLPRKELLETEWEKLSKDMITVGRKIEQELGKRPQTKPA